MQITDHEVIKSGEQELIDAITADLDWEAIEDVFGKEHKLKIEDNVEYKKGDIVVYDGQVVYKLEFDVNIVLTVLLDRDGNYLAATSSGDLENSQDGSEGGMSAESEASESKLEDGRASTFSELDAAEASETGNENVPLTGDGDPQEEISELASQAGDMLSRIKDDGQVNAEAG